MSATGQSESLLGAWSLAVHASVSRVLCAQATGAFPVLRPGGGEIGGREHVAMKALVEAGRAGIQHNQAFAAKLEDGFAVSKVEAPVVGDAVEGEALRAEQPAQSQAWSWAARARGSSGEPAGSNHAGCIRRLRVKGQNTSQPLEISIPLGGFLGGLSPHIHFRA